MMTQFSKLFIACCFAFTFGLVVQADAPQIEAQVISEACGCGNAKCGGCLKGRLFPVKNLAHAVKAKKPCGCAACQTAGKSVVTSDVLVSTEYLPEVANAPAVACGCGKKSCGLKRGRKTCAPRMRSCPQCDCDFCELKVSKTKDKKKCFVVKQKEVCIPPVRLPWKKCCPPTKAKVRVVNVLSSKTYECPGCKYEWKVFEPEAPKVESESAEAAEPPADAAKIEEVDPAAPTMSVPETPQIEKLDLETVPKPPVESN